MKKPVPCKKPFSQSTLCRNDCKVRVYTKGYANMYMPFSFWRIIKKYGIDLIIDVRSKPDTRRFSETDMESMFGNQYISRKDLGGLKYEPDRYDDWHQGAVDGLIFLEILLKENKTILLLCAEKKSRDCHRRYFVGRYLNEKGFTVSHL